MAQLKFQGRVLEVLAGNEKYPNSSVTFIDKAEHGGQIRINVPPDYAKALVLDGLYDLDISVRGRLGAQFGKQSITIIGGKITPSK